MKFLFIFLQFPGFLQPSNKKQIQAEAAKEFRTLNVKMIRCEKDQEYERLWQDYNKILMKEPFLPKKYKVITTGLGLDT